MSIKGLEKVRFIGVITRERDQRSTKHSFWCQIPDYSDDGETGWLTGIEKLTSGMMSLSFNLLVKGVDIHPILINSYLVNVGVFRSLGELNNFFLRGDKKNLCTNCKYHSDDQNLSCAVNPYYHIKDNTNFCGDFEWK